MSCDFVRLFSDSCSSASSVSHVIPRHANAVAQLHLLFFPTAFSKFAAAAAVVFGEGSECRERSEGNSFTLDLQHAQQRVVV